MAQFVKLDTTGLIPLRRMDPRLVSYNVEMTEVTDGTFLPRPNYFAAKLWNNLMGSTVYASGIRSEEGKHVYCHSRKAGMRSRTMCLNGKELTLGENDNLPALVGIPASGAIEAAPGSCTFVVL